MDTDTTPFSISNHFKDAKKIIDFFCLITYPQADNLHSLIIALKIKSGLET
jgi:hypothetical protein